MSAIAWKLTVSLRHRWHDGTEMTIRGAGAGRGTHLTITHPLGLRVHSHHASIAAAKAHAEEFLASLTARDIDAYRETAADDQMELL